MPPSVGGDYNWGAMGCRQLDGAVRVRTPSVYYVYCAVVYVFQACLREIPHSVHLLS